MGNILKKKISKIYFLIFFVFSFSISAYKAQTVTFNYTGAVQTWVVPPCVNTINVTAAGAKGGGTTGGNGALVSATLSVTQGQTFYIYVGGNGICGSNTGGGWNGGGTGKIANSAANGSCGGGGATDLRIGGTTLNDRAIVAAGGGGMGGGTQDATGGFGGCTTGGTGVNSFGGGGTGGTLFSGGNGGTPWGSGLSGSAGIIGQGGDGATDNCYNNSPGGGGGGGFYGGGSGGADCFASAPYGGGGGGGGSSLIPAGGSCNQGINSQPNGYLTISYTIGTGVASANNTGPYCEGSTIQLNGSLADTYSWSGPNGFTSNIQSPSIPNSSSLSGGVYTLTTTYLGCTSTGTTNVTINPLPTVNAGPDQTVCANTSITLNATGASFYSWSNGVTDGIPFNPPLGTNIYSVGGISAQGCLNTDNVTITVLALTAPTFTQISPICNGGAISLPSASNNSITGNWSPAVNNTQTTTYTFTPTSGQCANTGSMTVTVTQPLIPTFAQINPICSGDALTLPSSSSNGFTGIWSPAVNNTSTTSYTFTPDAGQCATSAPMTVTVNQPVLPVFSQISPICSGGTINLPTTSTNSYIGSWSPAINNTATTAYTFTPASGQCATSTNMTVTVNQPVTPTFATWGPYCQDEIIAQLMLPIASQEGINGNWNPGMVSTSTPGNNVYTFTPNASECANVATITVVINPTVLPTFTSIAPICSGDVINLNNTSLENITGTWSPAVNNTQTTTYTFTPSSGQCVTTNTLTVNVGTPTPPTFAQINPICSGDALLLPTGSTNGFTGTWSPVINNTATTTYTFTPTAGQCATTAPMTVTVNQPVLPVFAQINPICSGGTINLPTTSTNSYSGLWSPAVNNTATTNYTFTPTAGQCATTSAMTVTVNQPVTPTFAPWGPYCQDAIIAQVMLPTASQEGINGTWNPGMVSTSTPGNNVYTFTPNASECANVTTMTVVVNPNVLPTFAAIAPICVGDPINLINTSLESITGTWSPAVNSTQTTTYTFTPSSGQCATTNTLTVNVGAPVTPTFTPIPSQCAGSPITLSTSSLEGFTGTWSPAINNLVTTNYTYTPTAGQCATTAAMTVVISAPVQATFAAMGPYCSGSTFSLPVISIEGYTGVWSPAINNQSTTNYTFTVNPGQCALNGALTVNISSNPTVDITSATLTNESCNQMDGSIAGIVVNNGTPNYTYQWNNNASLNTLDLQGLNSGTYDLEVSDQLGCTATVSLVIGENQAPTIDASGINVTQPTCLQGGSINGILVNGNGPFDYQWTNTTQITASINNLADGNYSLTVTDFNGCTVNYGPVTITTPAGPTAAFTWSPNEPNVADNVSFTNNSNAVTNFNSEWTIGNTSFNSTNLDYSFTDNGFFDVQLVVTDMNNCMDTLIQTIYVIGDATIPNVLTLNNDGKNEVFLIDALKSNSSLVIINRWGNVVFETDNYLNDWNGTNKETNDRVTDGVYTYLLIEPNGMKKHGFIHVVH